MSFLDYTPDEKTKMTEFLKTGKLKDNIKKSLK